MKKNLNLRLSIVLIWFLSACGTAATNPDFPSGPGQPVFPAVESTPANPDFPSEPAQPVSPAVEPALVYTADGSQCQRTLATIGSTGGGRGESYFPKSQTGNALLYQLENSDQSGAQFAKFSPSGQELITGGYDPVRLWDTATGDRLLEIPISAQEAVFSEDEQSIMFGTYEGSVVVWDRLSGTQQALFQDQGTTNQHVAISRDGRWIATTHNPAHQTASLWDDPSVALLLEAETGEVVRRFEGQLLEKIQDNPDISVLTFTRGHTFHINALEFSPNGQVLLTAGNDAAVRMWDVTTGEHLRCFESPVPEEHENVLWDYFGLARLNAGFSPDGRRVYANFGYAVLVWDALTGQLLTRIDFPDQLVPEIPTNFNQASFAMSGKAILTAGGDQFARLWDVESGRLLTALRHSGEVLAATASPGSDQVVTMYSETYFQQQPEFWVWDLNHPTLAAGTEAQRKFNAAYAAILDERVEDSMKSAAEALAIEPDPALGLGYAVELCRYAVVFDWVEQALPLCDQVVLLAEQVADIELQIYARESRGIARSLSDDADGAIPDFEFCQMNAPEQASGHYYYRSYAWSNWMAALQAGEQAITEGELVDLRLGYPPRPGY